MKPYIRVFVLFFMVAGFAHADSWLPARVKAAVSEDGHYIVRIVPGNSMENVYGYGGEPKGNYASAVVYFLNDREQYVLRQRFTLQNPIAPVYFAVSNRGELVTLDNWHNMGIGSVVVVYQRGGKILKKYRLQDLYSEQEIQKMDATASSIWWRCHDEPFLIARESLLIFQDGIGNDMQVDLTTGIVSRTGEHAACYTR